MSHVHSSSYVAGKRVYGVADLAEFQLCVLGQQQKKKLRRLMMFSDLEGYFSKILLNQGVKCYRIKRLLMNNVINIAETQFR